MEVTSNLPEQDRAGRRADELFREQQMKIYLRTDRMFANLMLFQWVAGIAAAIWISPRTWIGTQSQIHLHVWAAVLIGGVITSMPAILAWKRPGHALTRHVIAAGQMLTSGLLIHLMGGRIEAHFHVFGSLAFLAFYRDWRVLVTASVVVAADHFARGVYWPQSVFGVLASSHWRWVEHAVWVVFEDFFLFLSVGQGLTEMRMVAERQATLESINRGIEQIVQERTHELELSHKQLVEASRRAGMAEVATSVLHNVGNVLNSINVSASVVSERLKRSKTGSVVKVATLMREHQADLADFVTNDPKGRQLPTFLNQLGEHLTQEQSSVLEELNSLSKNIDHVKDIVATQQEYAKVAGVTETVAVSDLVEDAVRMNASALVRHDVQFFREYGSHPVEVTVEKHKVLQILVNLIRNAKQACDESGLKEKRMTVRIVNGDEKVRIALIDNGIGIATENLNRIFNHGFTTKKDGHGFGLHSGALAARQMGGSLAVTSEGPGKGATFTLELPIEKHQLETA